MSQSNMDISIHFTFSNSKNDKENSVMENKEKEGEIAELNQLVNNL